MATSNFTTVFLQNAMGAFVSILSPITAMSYAVNNQAILPGDTVKVPYATNTSGSALFDYATGYATKSGLISAKTITVDQIAYQYFELSDADFGKVGQDGVGTMARVAGERLANDVMSASIAATVTNANFPTSASCTQGQLTASAGLILLNTQADNAKWPQDNRNLILNPTAWASLLSNTAVNQAYSYGGANVIQNALPEKVFGFNTYKTTVELPNSCNGLVLNPAAILVGFGLHRPASTSQGLVSMESVTDTKSGIGLSMRSWYNAEKATSRFALECLFGSGVGNTSALYQMK